jgi:hypothetical protein
MAGYELPPLELSDGDLFGAALLTPQFTSDLSTWTATIHKHGLLTQTVLLAQPPGFDEQLVTLRQHVPKDTLESLKQIVDDEELLSFGQFPKICMTDQAHTCLIVRQFGKTSRIEAYGPHAVAQLGDTDADQKKARRFCRLWDAILSLTPFTPYQD